MNECDLSKCKHISDLEQELAEANAAHACCKVWADDARKQRDAVVEAATDLLDAWDNKRALAWQPDGHQDFLRALRKAVDTRWITPKLSRRQKRLIRQLAQDIGKRLGVRVPNNRTRE